LRRAIAQNPDADRRHQGLSLALGLNLEAHGGDGDDVMFGENGQDSLYSEGGNDRLYGGNGPDTLVGGTDDGEEGELHLIDCVKIFDGDLGRAPDGRPQHQGVRPRRGEQQ
jgi:Ca2+-binding RTX toxin-like protein